MIASSLQPFKLGQGSPANTFLAVWVAADAGLFKANGLDMSIVPMTGGSQSATYFKSGRIDMMHIGMSSVVRANAGGADLVVFGSLSNIIRGDLFVAPGITSAADLKNGIVGISSAGSETDTTTTLALRKLGLKRTDVKIEEVGTPRLQLLQSGRISATTLGEPERSEAFAKGVKCLLPLYEARIPWVYSGLVTTRSRLKSGRSDIVAALRAIVEGNVLALKDPPLAKSALARELSLSDTKLIDESYANFCESTPLDTKVSREGAANILSVIDIPGASHNSDDYIDDSIYDELAESGFLSEIARKYG